MTVDDAVISGPDRDVIDADRLHVWAARIRELRAWDEHYMTDREEDEREDQLAAAQQQRADVWLMAGRLCRPSCLHRTYCRRAGAAVFCDCSARMTVHPSVLRMRCVTVGCGAWSAHGDIYCARCAEEISARAWEQPNLDRGFWTVLAAVTGILVLAAVLIGCVR